MLEVGMLLDGKYKILNKVGQGGMSVVYLAMNEKANKQWAVKEVNKSGQMDFESVRQGLIAETDILKRLNHPNLPSIIDVIDTDDCFIIIMDYIEGNSLNKALEEFGAQPQEHVIKWAKQLCDVLGYLHSRQPPIIYRDMKPANVMLRPDGNVMLIDFGTAREFKEKNLADTACLGTVGYAAPEQFGGMGQTDARTDIYCLGATLYHLVTGMNPCEPPYEIRPIREINPALSGGLERIILKCTQRDPQERFQSAAELMYALEHIDEIDDTYRRKQKKKLGACIAAAAVTVLFGVTSVWSYLSAENQKKNDYDNIIKTASSYIEYYDAILTDPTRTEAYLGTGNEEGNGNGDGMINLLVTDGTLDADESTVFVKLKGGLDDENSRGYSTTVDVMGQLQQADPSGYQEVCNAIGEAYLFYYDVGVEKDKYAAAASWFQYAQDDYPAAKIYCDISECMQNISKYSKAEQYTKLYEEYESLWSQMLTLKQSAADFDEDLQLRVWDELTSMIRNNASELCEVATTDEILDMLDEIEQDSESVTNTFLQGSLEKLRKDVETTQTKIRSVADSEVD